MPWKSKQRDEAVLGVSGVVGTSVSDQKYLVMRLLLAPPDSILVTSFLQERA